MPAQIKLLLCVCVPTQQVEALRLGPPRLSLVASASEIPSMCCVYVHQQVEALRLGPPRLSLEQSSSPSISSAITAAASQAARMYWVAPVPGAVQNPQQAAQTPQQAVIQGCQQQKQQQQGPPPAAGMGPEYERILQRYNRGGSSTSGAVQGAGQQQYSQQDTPQGKRHQALVAAMWALACLVSLKYMS
jgi:hypothetical protein